MLLTDGTTKQLHCLAQVQPIRDALEVVGGKWKVLVLTSIMQGSRRFREIETSIPKLNPKVLAKELKDLEEHQLIRRTVYEDDYPVRIEYTATEYAYTLKQVMLELHAWGENHRRKVFGK
ncbi:transcriptional regulator [Hymenobacter gummosus]|uniref:Transcriptional regulator n=1 Tax=Hymenobacter gummosus TaxID=1776032 RepID=A0A3S0JAF6_9BACT|nr:helix-turn-helix domain-containing protein [Hymenobacter gummosus]RTQ45389.1 transcriptional regulator [Hymenobacter gummosus]